MRLDELPGSYAITHTAKRHIDECRIAIIDLTGNRPNVYYELGFAHGKGKNCVLIAHSDTEPQFYSAEYNILYYSTESELKRKLIKHLSGLIGR